MMPHNFFPYSWCLQLLPCYNWYYYVIFLLFPIALQWNSCAVLFKRYISSVYNSLFLLRSLVFATVAGCRARESMLKRLFTVIRTTLGVDIYYVISALWALDYRNFYSIAMLDTHKRTSLSNMREFFSRVYCLQQHFKWSIRIRGLFRFDDICVCRAAHTFLHARQKRHAGQFFQLSL